MNRFIAFAGVVCLLALGGCSPDGNSASTVVVMDTSMGAVKIELFDDDAPVTVKNFLKYVDAKHYDNTIFHRVIPGFMVQGGGFDGEMKEKQARGAAGIKNEGGNGKQNKRGTLAMARTNEPDSATDQFFINVVDNAGLDRKPGPGNEGYAVFGKVVDGMDVVDKIVKVKTANKGPHDDVPVQNVFIKSIKRQ